MDSSFSIALGETVVIGTSRLNGDQALIALLTAAAKPGRGPLASLFALTKRRRAPVAAAFENWNGP